MKLTLLKHFVVGDNEEACHQASRELATPPSDRLSLYEEELVVVVQHIIHNNSVRGLLNWESEELSVCLFQFFGPDGRVNVLIGG